MKSLIAVLFTIIAASCGTSEMHSINTITEPIDSANIQTENFDTFYVNFYQDSSFQISRIYFPLEGIIKYWDENNDTAIIFEKWQKENMPRISDKKTLMRHYNNLQSNMIESDSVVIEKYWINNSGFSIERRFKVIYGKWHIVYYDLFNL